MSQRVLVTGGAGFLGSHLVERLVAAGDAVVVLDDLSRGRSEWVHPQAELCQADIRTAEAVETAVAGAAPDAVVHLAAMHYIPAVDGAPELAWDVNVEATRVLLEALSARPPRLLLFASTAAVYPDRRGPISETVPPQPLDLYGRTKLEGERLVSTFRAETGTRCIAARIFNVIGARETNPHVVPEIVRQLREGGGVVRIGNLTPRRDYTDVVDVAAALHGLVVSKADGPTVFNLGSGRSTSVMDVIRACEAVVGRAIDVAVEPGRARVQDRAELVADARRLRDATGWKPTRSLHETLTELLSGSAAP